MFRKAVSRGKAVVAQVREHHMVGRAEVMFEEVLISNLYNTALKEFKRTSNGVNAQCRRESHRGHIRAVQPQKFYKKLLAIKYNGFGAFDRLVSVGPRADVLSETLGGGAQVFWKLTIFWKLIFFGN